MRVYSDTRFEISNQPGKRRVAVVDITDPALVGVYEDNGLNINFLGVKVGARVNIFQERSLIDKIKGRYLRLVSDEALASRSLWKDIILWPALRRVGRTDPA